MHECVLASLPKTSCTDASTITRRHLTYAQTPEWTLSAAVTVRLRAKAAPDYRGLRPRAGWRRGVTMGTRLYPLTGYPFLLDVAVDYVLDDEGLTVTTTATNRGEQTCPYGCGQHPYLSPGGGLVNDAVLSFAAGNRIITDPHRQLPTGTEPVGGCCFDFSQGRRLEDLRIDYAFFDLARDGAGRAWVRLEGPDGKRAELWVDGSYPIVERVTGGTVFPHPSRP